jgi:hypothetical protein
MLKPLDVGGSYKVYWIFRYLPVGFRSFLIYTMIAKKLHLSDLNTSHVSATIILTITSTAAMTISSIEDSEDDSLNQKNLESAWL